MKNGFVAGMLLGAAAGAAADLALHTARGRPAAASPGNGKFFKNPGFVS